MQVRTIYILAINTLLLTVFTLYDELGSSHLQVLTEQECGHVSRLLLHRLLLLRELRLLLLSLLHLPLIFRSHFLLLRSEFSRFGGHLSFRH